MHGSKMKFEKKKKVLWRWAKRLSYMEDARCLKVNILYISRPSDPRSQLWELYLRHCFPHTVVSCNTFQTTDRLFWLRFGVLLLSPSRNLVGCLKIVHDGFYKLINIKFKAVLTFDTRSYEYLKIAFENQKLILMKEE